VSAPLNNITGLASGLDTNQIVAQLMAIESQPKVRVQQKQLVEEARQNALRDVQTRLQNLADAAAGLRDVGTWADVQSVTSSSASTMTAVRTSGAAAGGYLIQVSQLARAQQVKQTSALTAAAAGDTLTLKVGSGTSIDVAVAAGDSIDTIAQKINGATGSPVYASAVDGKLVLTSKTTGSANTISATSTGTLAANLGLAQTVAPLDAKFSVDGIAQPDSASNTVTTAVSGVTLTFLTTGSSTITVGSPGPDTDAVKQKVQAFVDQYNSTIDFIRSKLNEPKVAMPKTDADRTKGVLQGDQALSGLLSSLRQAVSDVVGGRPTDMAQVAQAGLSTGATTGDGTLSQDSIAGKLTLDADELTSALTGRFSDVKALFSNETGDYTTEGLAQRFDRLLKPFTQSTGILSTRISSEDDIIADLKDQQADWDQRLSVRESALRAQFATLESTLSQLQAQSSWLSGQLAGLAG